MPPGEKPNSSQNPPAESRAESDLRYKVPDLVPFIKPGEKVIEVTKYPDVKQPAKGGLVSSMSELLRLSGTASLTEMGRQGPLVASKAAETEDRQEMRAYEVVFGRDSLIVAHFLRHYYPALMRGTLLKLAALLGQKFDPVSEEEPGKIVHEARDPSDPIAQKITAHQGWGWPYYGAVDATPLFITELAREAKYDPDLLDMPVPGKEYSLGHSLQAALDFVEEHISQSDLGLLEYKRLNSRGLENQWWADSWDSMSHSDGAIANHDQPIAALVVQAFAYDALLEGSELYARLAEQDPSRQAAADRYAAMAAHLKQQVIDKFWKDDGQGGFFVVGLDRDEQGHPRQLDTKTGHMGFVLSSRLLDDDSERSRQMVDRTVNLLFSDELQNAAGIRTLSKKEVRYRPGGYHTGSVWPWVNNWVANGLDKHARLADRPDYAEKAWVLREKTWRIVQKYKKFPELVNGGDSPEPQLNWRRVVITEPEAAHNSWTPGTNTIEQPAQDFQAWTIAAYIDALRRNNPL